MGEHISGVIMFKETLYQSSAGGRPFVDCLADQGIMAGIKLDEVRHGVSHWSVVQSWGAAGCTFALRARGPRHKALQHPSIHLAGTLASEV